MGNKNAIPKQKKSVEKVFIDKLAEMPLKQTKEHIIYFEKEPKCIVINEMNPGRDYHLNSAYSDKDKLVFTKADDPDLQTKFLHKIYFLHIPFEKAIVVQSEHIKQLWTAYKSNEIIARESIRRKKELDKLNNEIKLLKDTNEELISKNKRLINKNKKITNENKNLKDAIERKMTSSVKKNEISNNSTSR